VERGTTEIDGDTLLTTLVAQGEYIIEHDGQEYPLTIALLLQLLTDALAP
jgi:hemin uptake protein HemP